MSGKLSALDGHITSKHNTTQHLKTQHDVLNTIVILTP